MNIRVAAIASIATLTLCAASAAQPLDATQAKALIAKAECKSCHAVDERVVGPAYQEVAKRYKGDAAAPERLFLKVRAGGGGTYGLVGPHAAITMPPNSSDKISDDDLKKLIAWILAL
jgi:cytochrome c